MDALIQAAENYDPNKEEDYHNAVKLFLSQNGYAEGTDEFWDMYDLVSPMMRKDKFAGGGNAYEVMEFLNVTRN